MKFFNWKDWEGHAYSLTFSDVQPVLSELEGLKWTLILVEIY